MRLTNWLKERSPRQAWRLAAMSAALAAVAAFLWANATRPPAKAYTELQSFEDAGASVPVGALALDPSGALYGATQLGGAAGNGAVFSLKPPERSDGTWKETILYDFASEGDGRVPVGSLVIGKDGSLYGVTAYGGAGYGTIFRLTSPAADGAGWTETVLYQFKGGADGANPRAGLVADANGALYGTTLWGGASGHGTVFKLFSPTGDGRAWKLATIHRFQGGADGSAPRGKLALDANGALYGTTQTGGASNHGTVFKLTPPATPGAAWNKTTLYSFGGDADGDQPLSGLTIAPDGALLGTTFHGGGSPHCYGGCGTVFQLKPSTAAADAWTETVIHRFQGATQDGGNPLAVTLGPNGSLYGVAQQRGAHLCGVVYELDPPKTPGASWTEVILYNFPGGGPEDARHRGAVKNLADASTVESLYGELVVDRQGDVYGAIPRGGAHHTGAVYELH